ncbi:hypothetical protein TSUD_20710 [Trifolium subterraneum]|uniref:Uncharacterized protein n=1 Tax=Trifolium subterraneum TaxID=3900 RepID=A0A2Z6MP52_TRISU|nr:hypothetical protein TSUD_20710 [Trifolium subterraneum]
MRYRNLACMCYFICLGSKDSDVRGTGECYGNSMKRVMCLMRPKLDELRKMSENALKLANPDALFQVVRDIHELAKQCGPYFIFQLLVVTIIADLELVINFLYNSIV